MGSAWWSGTPSAPRYISHVGCGGGHPPHLHCHREGLPVTHCRRCGMGRTPWGRGSICEQAGAQTTPHTRACAQDLDEYDDVAKKWATDDNGKTKFDYMQDKRESKETFDGILNDKYAQLAQRELEWSALSSEIEGLERAIQVDRKALDHARALQQKYTEHKASRKANALAREVRAAARKARHQAAQANAEFITVTRSEPRIPADYESHLRDAEAAGRLPLRMGSAWDLTASEEEVRNVRVRSALASTVLPDAELLEVADSDALVATVIEEVKASVKYIPPELPVQPQGPFDTSSPTLSDLIDEAYQSWTERWGQLSYKQKCRALGLMIVQDEFTTGTADVIRDQEEVCP